MAKYSEIILNGESLTLDQLDAIANGSVSVALDPSALQLSTSGREFLDQWAQKQVIYGVNTGFGPMASHIVGQQEIGQLQVNLIRSHATGLGEPIDPRYVLAAMVIRLNMLLKGYSGASIELIKQLQLFINKRIIPVVPDHGAVGTSGDLVQLAHIALALIGEGEVWHDGRRQATAAVLSQLGIAPHTLQAKEGLALINGTSVMSGIGALLCIQAQRLFDTACVSGALALELINGFNDSYSQKLSQLRPHTGQIYVAQRLREILADSTCIKNRHEFLQRSAKDKIINHQTHEIDESVQDFYSFRCQPQILGPIYDTLIRVRDVLTVEINAVTDNPLVDSAQETFLHGGNFHGDYISWAMDQLKIVMTKLSILSERRINFFLHHKINGQFPPFLNLNQPGLTLALQGLQFVATSTTARNQTLSFPQYIHSIPTNADNQDVVSMGTDAALVASQVIENTAAVLAIELVTLSQAVGCVKKEKTLSRQTKQLVQHVRRTVPLVTADRVLYQEVEQLRLRLLSNF